MLIEIQTKSRPYQNGFALYRFEILDGIKQGITKDFEQTDNQLQADLLNIGLAIKSIMQFDNQFGVIVKEIQKHRITDKDFKTIFNEGKERKRVYAESLESCEAIIYTENIEVFENFYYTQRAYDNPLIRKMFARIIYLQKEYQIKITLEKSIMEVWQDAAKRKYA